MTAPDDPISPNVPATGSQPNAALAQMSQGEKMFGLGAAMVLAADLIGGLIAEEYVAGHLVWFLAALGLAAVYVQRFRSGVLPLPYGWVLGVIGLSVAAVTIRVFLGDVTNNLFDRGAGTIIFALITYAGAALMGVGGWQARKS